MPAYFIPPVPGGIYGQSAALAYMQGARTPGAFLYQTAKNYVLQLIVVLVVVGIILLIKYFYFPDRPLIETEPAPETTTATPENFESKFTESFSNHM
jgi:hypothetical protein